MQNADADSRTGVIAGVLAFTMWGAFPIYFKFVEDVSAMELLAHRVVWAVPFGAMIIFARRQWAEVWSVFTNWRMLSYLTVSAFFISVNWLIYIWAVINEQIFQASLGYYINPLMLMLVGFLFLGERMRRMQVAAVICATSGVVVLTFTGGQFPALSIGIAVAFTVYSVIRKKVVIGAMPGLFVETAILFPLALAYLLMLAAAGTLSFTLSDPSQATLLALAGPFTVMPLLMFAIAARRLPLSTIGFLQFIGPTGQFFIGYYYDEPLTTAHIICFGLIWTAAALFIVDVWYNARRAPNVIANRPG
jgi:chloramphenicol-sensitive protein RarD